MSGFPIRGSAGRGFSCTRYREFRKPAWSSSVRSLLLETRESCPGPAKEDTYAYPCAVK